MPIFVPSLDNRRYQDLLDEALARIPVYTPEYTNFNKSDPGVTLIEVFAFMVENLLYRANYIPERNRLKFLSLLGIPLHPGSAARGVVTFQNERGPLQTFTLNADLEVRAGAIPYRTERGLDVLPIEAQLYTKQRLTNPPEEVKTYYKQLYSSYIESGAVIENPPLYETKLFAPRGTTTLDLSTTIDGSLWIALLARPGESPFSDAQMDGVRESVAGRILSLGFIPQLSDPNKTLPPGGLAEPQTENLLRYQMPLIPPDGKVPRSALKPARVIKR
jgi:predicted phage baseplate assembly protein